MITITNQEAGTVCSICKQQIEVGEQMAKDVNRWSHVECSTEEWQRCQQQLDTILNFFAMDFEAKYKEGQSIHGGDFFQLKHPLQEAKNEVLDLVSYMFLIEKRKTELLIELEELKHFLDYGATGDTLREKTEKITKLVKEL